MIEVNGAIYVVDSDMTGMFLMVDSGGLIRGPISDPDTYQTISYSGSSGSVDSATR